MGNLRVLRLIRWLSLKHQVNTIKTKLVADALQVRSNQTTELIRGGLRHAGVLKPRLKGVRRSRRVDGQPMSLGEYASFGTVNKQLV